MDDALSSNDPILLFLQPFLFLGCRLSVTWGSIALPHGLVTFGLLKSSQPTIAGEHRAQKSWWLMITWGHVNWFYDVLHILYNPLLKSLASNLLHQLFQAVVGGYRCFLQGRTLVSWPLNSPKFNPSIRCLRWEQPWTRGASRHEPRATAIVAQRGLGCASGAGALEIEVRREGYFNSAWGILGYSGFLALHGFWRLGMGLPLPLKIRAGDQESCRFPQHWKILKLVLGDGL